ncbi:MAG: hypothetical protein ABJL99_19590 [Aliishimia sp.]
MSEPVSNAEVEDVLASIRRLVSEEKRPVLQGKKATAKAKPAASPDVGARSVSAEGKLVLTPSLRVMEPETSENVAQTSVPKADVTGADTKTETDDVGVKVAQATVVDQDTVAATNARTAAALVAKMTKSNSKDIVDVSSGNDVPETSEALDANALFAKTTATEDVKQDTQDTAQTDDGVSAAPRVDPSSLSAKIAALEAVIGKREDHWEPDGVAGSDDYSGTENPAIAWEDHVVDAEDPIDDDAAGFEPDGSNETVEVQSEEPVLQAGDDQKTEAPKLVVSAATAEADEVDESSALLEGEAILDEEALRDMVADIVRQELQGALGERITRNVRKLVRREIQRALAAQELD